VAGRPDIAIVSLGTTPGWRLIDAALADQIRAAGASCRVVRVTMGPAGHLRRAMALTDVVESLAAVHAADGVKAGATIFSTVTAALFQPLRRPHAIQFDTTASLSRPGVGGAWQRRREPAVLSRADLLLPLSDTAAAAAEAAIGKTRGSAVPRQIVLPPPIRRAEEPATDAPDAVAYAGNPEKRGLELLCQAWAQAGPPGARLAVGGIERDEGLRWLARHGVAEPAGITWEGRVPHERWLTLVAGARVFVSAARFEDWGVAQMEALAAGTPLVAVAATGPNPALPLAREIGPALVAAEPEPSALAAALRAGLGMDENARATYASEAQRLTASYREDAVQELVAREVLPALLSSSA
jgi:glycosyltransferase involved in cell wall biosynthesis